MGLILGLEPRSLVSKVNINWLYKKKIKLFQFHPLTFDLLKIGLRKFFYHFFSIVLSRSFFFTISSIMSFFLIKFDHIFFITIVFLLEIFLNWYFFSQFHHLKLNCLEINLLDWTRLKEFHYFHGCGVCWLPELTHIFFHYFFKLIFFNLWNFFS